MPDEITNDLTGVLDDQPAKAVNITTSTPASKEYTDDKGDKVVVSEAELNPQVLSTADIKRVESISNLTELKAKPLCQNCRFWNPTEIRQNKDGKPFPINGECRANAPQLIEYGESFATSFPLIGPYQWCGKYEKIA